jgi:hypothetical protein
MKVPRPLDNVPRIAASDIPLDVSASVLCDCKTKNSTDFKKTMMRSRERVVDLKRTPAKSLDERLKARAKGCQMAQLIKGMRRGVQHMRTLTQHLVVLERLYEQFPSLQGLTERIGALRMGLKSNLDLFNAFKEEYELRLKPRTKLAAQ